MQAEQASQPISRLGGTYLIDAHGYLLDARGWRFRSAAHFAERHGLIIIIALGESIVAIGVGVTNLPISWPILLASLLGLHRPMVAGSNYVLGHVGFKRRTVHQWSVSRLITAALTLIAVPVLAGVPALGQLAVLTVLLAGLVAYESVRFAQERDELKHGEQHA